MQVFVEDSASVVVRLFAVTSEGHSVCCRVTGFRPYFYVELPETSRFEERLESFRDELNKKVVTEIRNKDVQ